MDSLEFSQDSEMVQRVKVLATKSEDPSLIPGSRGGIRDPALSSPLISMLTLPHPQAGTHT